MKQLEKQSQQVIKKNFPKKERLCSKKDIEHLFKSGITIFSFPYKIYLASTDKLDLGEPKILITVPKRNFKKAVDRNKLKRLFREAYRNNKYRLDLSISNKPLHIAFLYIHSEILDYEEIEKKLVLSLDKVNQQLRKK